MAIYSSILGRKIPWSEEPGMLQSTGSQTVGPNTQLLPSFPFHMQTHSCKQMAAHWVRRRHQTVNIMSGPRELPGHRVGGEGAPGLGGAWTVATSIPTSQSLASNWLWIQRKVEASSVRACRCSAFTSSLETICKGLQLPTPSTSGDTGRMWRPAMSGYGLRASRPYATSPPR